MMKLGFLKEKKIVFSTKNDTFRLHFQNKVNIKPIMYQNIFNFCEYFVKIFTGYNICGNICINVQNGKKTNVANMRKVTSFHIPDRLLGVQKFPPI